jgi:hypothetical protein
MRSPDRPQPREAARAHPSVPLDKSNAHGIERAIAPPRTPRRRDWRRSSYAALAPRRLGHFKRHAAVRRDVARRPARP